MSKRGSSATTLSRVQNEKKRLTRFLRTIDTVPIEILDKEADRLWRDIALEVPYKEGKLFDSVRVRVSKDKRRPGLNASASARSKNGYNYAGIQHENTNYKHSRPGTKAHYISDPFDRCIGRIEEQMLEKLKLGK